MVTILILVVIGGGIRPVFEMSSEHLVENYGGAFTNVHLEFDYYRNVLFPHLFFLALLYGCYCWMNLYIIPHFMRGLPPGKPGLSFRLAMHPGRIIWCLLNVALLTTVLGVGWGDAWSYLDYPTIVDQHFTTAMVIGAGLEHVTGWVVGYILYAVFREVAIRRMEQEPMKNAHWITLANQAVGFFLLYYTLGAVAVNFLFGGGGDSGVEV